MMMTKKEFEEAMEEPEVSPFQAWLIGILIYLAVAVTAGVLWIVLS